MSTGYVTSAIKAEMAALWTTATIKAVALNAGYVFSETHSSLADVLAGARLATTTVTGRTVTGGRCDCAAITWSAVPAGPSLVAPSTVNARVTIGAPTITAGPLVGPTTVQATVSMGSPTMIAIGPLTQVWLYKDTGVEATSTLIFYASKYIDGASVNIPTTGAPVTLSISGSPNGVFTI